MHSNRSNILTRRKQWKYTRKIPEQNVYNGKFVLEEWQGNGYHVGQDVETGKEMN
jgi:hypothetical protein